MLEKLLQFILHQRLLIILAAILLLGAGVIAWNHLPMDAFPDATNQQVMILTNAPGLTPTEVERLVTFPIEINMGGLPGVRQVRSLSKIGLSQVIIIFEDKIDTYFARQVVFERLAQAADQLPEGIEPELGPISTGLGEIYQYILEAGYYCPEHKQVEPIQPDGFENDSGLGSQPTASPIGRCQRSEQFRWIRQTISCDSRPGTSA